MYEPVVLDAVLAERMIDVDVFVYDTIVDVEAELYTDVHTYDSRTSIYDGKHEFTPSSETQIINTQDKIVTKDIVIKPIPPNYGLISWNGAVLTVS